MSLPAPHLDDRRFQDLVDDAKRMVMQRCPEWTDHNVSDPGVTLIETFAFMTDQLLYRLNQVPDRLYLKFLDLIGIQLIPPTAARTELTFWLSAPTRSEILVPAGTAASSLDVDAEHSVEFTTTADLLMPSCELAEVLSLDAAGNVLQPRDEHLRLDIDFPAFGSGRPEEGDCMFVGLTEPAPRCMVRLDFVCHTQGIGVDPDRPPLIWEAWDGTTWAPCAVHSDATGGLNRPGAVVLKMPDVHEASILDGRRAGWLRARVVPPGEDLPRYSSSPVIRSLASSVVGGTVEAIHAELTGWDTVGTTEGVPGEQLKLSWSPVVISAFDPVLETASDDGWLRWTRVEHFADSGPDDAHYVLDAASGTVQFGPVLREPDGTLRRHGLTPLRDVAVRARYATGGGRRGNVAAGVLRSLKSSVPNVSQVENLIAAQGGVDAETIDEVKARGPLLLRTRNRAVTSEDFEVITREAAPEIARVRCLDAGVEDVAPGSVKVLVVPSVHERGGHLRFEDLIPSPAVLSRITARLEETRLIGTTVQVEPPLYQGVTVVARLRATVGADVSRVTEDVLLALYGFVNPVTGGPGGTGWPFGRPVQSGDLYAVIHSVEGVDLVEEVRLFGANPVTGERGPQTDRLELDPHSLAFSYEHRIKVEEQR
ncbi:putative baseplate assembly protein [Streptomyces vinaceus]|uniref:putative baseplate assembly protein n=1 Tax=Streptomyces vinaceus TaxID=1960 RepID=UPI003823A025